MRKPLIRAYLAISLDGYIARPDGDVDWLSDFDPTEFGYDEFIAGIGAIVMGRASYEKALGFGAWPYGDIPAHVISRNPLPQSAAPVRRVDPDFSALSVELRRQNDGDVWLMGGAQAIDGFLAAGALDRLELYVVPRLIGAGLPLLPPARRNVPLTLLEHAALAKGVVRLVYGLP